MERESLVLEFADSSARGHRGLRGHPGRLARAPAWRLVRVLQLVFTRNAYQRVIAPTIADLQYEYYEALGRKDDALARWVRIRGIVLIWWNIFSAIVVPVIRFFRGG